MGKCGFEERPYPESYNAFHEGLRMLEESLRNTEDSEAIIDGLLRGAAGFYGAKRASVVEADWELGIGIITHEWCAEGVESQKDMLQNLEMELFPRWKKALDHNMPIVTADMKELEPSYPDEAHFFEHFGVKSVLAAPFSKRINKGFIVVDDPMHYTDDPAFLFIVSYAVVVELNEIKQQQSILAATRASKCSKDDIHINFFGGMEIIGPKGTLTGDDIKTEQGYLLLSYLLLNHDRTVPFDQLMDVVHHLGDSDSPYKFLNNVVYRIRRPLSIIGLEKLIIGKNGTFVVNPELRIHTDFDRFEENCRRLKYETNPEMKLVLYRNAMELYKGRLLPRIRELWHTQLDSFYQSMYLCATKWYAQLKFSEKEYLAVQKVATDALRYDNEDSELNLYAILAVGLQGNTALAKKYFDEAKRHLSEEHRMVLREHLGLV